MAPTFVLHRISIQWKRTTDSATDKETYFLTTHTEMYIRALNRSKKHFQLHDEYVFQILSSASARILDQ